MALENLTGPDKFISALVPGNPSGGDDKREGDDHIRGIKNVLVNTFPNVNGVVTATDEQLDSTKVAKVSLAGDTMTGPLVVPAGSAAVPAFGIGAANVGFYGASGGINVSTGGAFKARFSQSADAEFLLGSSSSANSSANRAVLEINGGAQAFFGLSVGGATKGYFYTQGTDAILAATAATGGLAFNTNGVTRASIAADGTFTYQSSEVGWRRLPVVAPGGSVNIAESYVGKLINQTSGYVGITQAGSGFVAGDVITITNQQAGLMQLVQGGTATLRWGTGSFLTGSRNVASNGVVSLLCLVGGGSPVFVVTGTGIS
jgi:hypothetical protein